MAQPTADPAAGGLTWRAFLRLAAHGAAGAERPVGVWRT
jgi:hypothetical protein